MENGLPTIDTTCSSNPTSVYGSPRDDDANRLGLGLSPVKGLSVLDAPLPASFDSNGISLAARYGPWPSSMPSKFGLESPSPSLNAARDGRTSETLKLLHTSAFGSSEHLSSSAIGTSETNGFGSSPPVGGASGLSSGLGSDEYFGKRAMHSSSLRYTKPRLISSSAPKIDRDWETEFLFEEDYVPGSLANEVLTPAEKARRGSTTTNTLRPMDSLEPGVESAPMGSAKFGSPSMSASPSRWGPLWQRQQKDEDAFLDAPGSGRQIKHASAFGHVGSPLRNSSLATAISAELNGDSNSNPTGRQASGSESLSVLAQQLRETRLGDGAPRSSPARNGSATANGQSSAAAAGGAAGVIGKEREKEAQRGLERHISSASISSSVTGRFTTPIDEEDPSFVFSMEEEDDAAQTRARKRVSGGAGGHPLSTAWTYANAATGSRENNTSGTTNGGSGTKPRAAGSSAVESTGI
jgi:cleavage and polyadenylation specificity factor subunit 4